MKLTPLAMLLAASLAIAGCSSSKKTAATDTAANETTAAPRKQLASGTAPADIPMAVIYKTNGRYADYVPVTLNGSHTALVSFPAPSDLAGGNPVELSDGFLLDRRGINQHSAFTRWTYAEYAALPAAPSPEEIMNNLIPGAIVTEIYRLPFAASAPDAASRADAAIAAGLKDCTLVYSAPSLSL